MKAAVLLRRIIDEKRAHAEGELEVPTYDDFGTPDNHVTGKKMKQVSNPTAGLDTKRDEDPNAEIGQPKKKEKRADTAMGLMDPNPVTVEGPNVGRGQIHEQQDGGEAGIDPKIPTGAIEWLVNRMHVSTTDDEVRKEIARRTEGKEEWTPELIKQAQEYAVSVHNRNQDLYTDVMRGKFGEQLLSEQEGNDEPKFEIWWKGPQGWEEVDTAKDKKEADYLIGEYRMAFGGGQFKTKPIKPTKESLLSEQEGNPIIRQLDMQARGGYLYFQNPASGEEYRVPWNRDAQQLIQKLATGTALQQPGRAASELYSRLARSRQLEPVREPRTSFRGGRVGGQEPETPPSKEEPRRYVGKTTGRAMSPQEIKRAASKYQLSTESVKVGHGAMPTPKAQKAYAKTKSASVRTKQHDEPTNKGKPGEPKKKEKRADKSGLINPNPVQVQGPNTGRGQIAEQVADLEKLLGQKLDIQLNEDEKKLTRLAQDAFARGDSETGHKLTAKANKLAKRSHHQRRQGKEQERK